MRCRWAWRVAVMVVPLACAGRSPQPTTPPSTAAAVTEAQPSPEQGDLSENSSLAEAEEALENGDHARAAALFTHFLGRNPEAAEARQAYPGLARAHELLGDFPAAVAAYDALLAQFPDSPGDLYAARGACHAELGHWELSAADFATAFAQAQVPSAQVEALARQGYAWFQLDDFAQADRLLAQADEIFLAAQAANSERFTTFYFVGMARFYRAAILHRRFREVTIREASMSADFARKLELLEQAQDRYGATIAAKHMFWVSAAGYQLGSLLEEFHDAVMYAPVPDWLDAAGRQTYYEELKNQLRPVVTKAAWVFEKNLETARKLGYDDEFVAQSEAKLSALQALLLAGDTALGQPLPRLAPEVRSEVHPEAATTPAGRKHFVPQPTPL